MNQPIPAPAAYPAVPAQTQLPLRAVQRLGQRTMRDGMYIGLIIALLGHVAAVGSPDYTMWMMHVAVVKMNRELKAYFKRTEEVEVIEDKEKEKADEPEPEVPVDPVELPDPVPSPIPPPESDDAKEEDTPYDDPEPYVPPAAEASEAQDVLTADDGAVDMTGDGWDILDNDGSTSRGTGTTARNGRKEGHQDNKHARGDGVGDGPGQGPPKPPPRPQPPKPDLSAKAKVLSGNLWNCPFPSAADLNQVDRAVVLLSVSVSPSGKVTGVSIQKDPGYGFGASARRCAMSSKWEPARNRDGRKVSSNPSVRVRFQR